MYITLAQKRAFEASLWALKNLDYLCSDVFLQKFLHVNFTLSKQYQIYLNLGLTPQSNDPT